jgi:hypothetical protein
MKPPLGTPRRFVVEVEVEGGSMQGLGYTYADSAAAGLINGTLAPSVGAMDARDPGRLARHATRGSQPRSRRHRRDGGGVGR